MAVQLTKALLCVSALSLLAACGQRERILPGDRLELRALDAAAGAPLDGTEAAPVAEAVVNRVAPVALAPMQANADWTHRAGTPSHNIAHPALSATPAQVWAVNIGAGEGRRARISADPVVAGGRVFTLDSAAGVTAVSTAGAVLWQADLVRAPDSDREAGGGGLAYGEGRLYVATAFGALHALDPATGAVIWTQDLDAPASGAPTVADGLVFVSLRDSRGMAVRASDGRIQWQVGGTPSAANRQGSSAPAVDGPRVLFPTGSGEILAADRATGEGRWRAAVTGRRLGWSASVIGDITGDPVAAGGRVFVGNASGRVTALNPDTGARLWTANEGALSPIWVEGGDLFFVSDRNDLLRLDAATGDRVWGAQLPFFTRDRVRRQREIFVNHGPVLAGGRLWVASTDGTLRGFAPESGALMHETALRGGAASNPVVAGQTLYVVTTNGQLAAFR
jgi:outer membrane protein assembly factor BamB